VSHRITGGVRFHGALVRFFYRVFAPSSARGFLDMHAVHEDDAGSTLWIHSHGMSRWNLPDLELRVRALLRARSSKRHVSINARERRHPRGRPRGSRVQHLRRPEVSPRRPHHVTVRVRRHVWNLRSQRCFGLVSAALRAVQRREGFRVIHFSVQGNHLHLIIEAEDRATFTGGARALLIRLAKSLNALMGTRGRVYADRFHETIVTSRRQMQVVVRYVLENHVRHMRKLGKSAPSIDRCSSAVCTQLVVRSAFS